MRFGSDSIISSYSTCLCNLLIENRMHGQSFPKTCKMLQVLHPWYYNYPDYIYLSIYLYIYIYTYIHIEIDKYIDI